MGDEFKIIEQTMAVNMMQRPKMPVYERHFKPKEHGQPSDTVRFDVISGSEGLVKNIALNAPATVDEKTKRKTITMSPTRLPLKRQVATAELVGARAFGEAFALEQMDARIDRENFDMVNKILRTMEWYGCSALQGKVYDSDLTTVLVDYNLPSSHQVTLEGGDRWSEAASDPNDKLIELKEVIEEDAGTVISGWLLYAGSNVYRSMLMNSTILKLINYRQKQSMAKIGDVQEVLELEVEKLSGSFVDDNGIRRRFLDKDTAVLVGLCDDLVDAPYGAVVDDDCPQGIGNVDIGGAMQLLFSKQWKEQDPSGRWTKVEARPLPVLRRPGAVIVFKPLG